MAGPGAIAELSVDDLRRRLDGGEAVAVLDVREDEERAFAAIRLPPAAVDLHVPMGQVPARLDEIRAAARSRPLVVYCHHGVRSRHVALWLARQGVEGVANLSGGIDAWSVGVNPDVPRY